MEYECDDDLVRITSDFADGAEVHMDPEETKSCLQYNEAKGLAGIRKWLEGLYRRVHNPPTMDNSDLPSSLAQLMTNGGRWGAVQVLKMVLEDGDCFLSEEVTYQSLIPSFLPRNITVAPVRSDNEGMDPVHLHQMMSEWDSKMQGRRPHLLYIIPSFCNPTGTIMTEQRKRKIYNVAREFNILILEDDPYYFLQSPLVPSFLSMDTDGRVIRTDSFSKTLSPGCRLGFLFGPKQIVDKMAAILHLESGGPSAVSQVMIYKVVQAWGYEKYLNHVAKVASLYKQRSGILLSYMDKHLQGLCEWTPTGGGMFQWVALLGVDKSEPVVDRLMERGVFVMDGSIFSVDLASRPNIRLCFARVSDEEMEKAVSTLAEVLKDMTGIQ
ncbi:kynurenine/alpha-aminoadipate aminotransferase, mitochondrial-like [Haliotis cracherodii]|uniref:kynurenine/alpha-aminoadipate aminotransferase, mitochondrial-like n=1 Tax=Haliotis cracherodii TaxID=6455 RepID=UPI0039ECBBF3